MTFTRAIIVCWMTSQYIEHADWQSRAVVILVAGFAWHFLTTDPLPGAIDRALDDYAKKWMGR